MKIRVERDQIVQAIRRMEGIEVVLENEHDAKEAVNLALGGSELFSGPGFQKLKSVEVSEVREYRTSAVEYEIGYLLEFIFEGDVKPQEKAAVIKTVQEFFGAFRRPASSLDPVS